MYTETKNNSEKYSEEIDIQKYLLVLKRRWLVISGLFATFITLGIVNFFIQPTTYKASGKLLLQLNRTSSLTGFGEKIGNLESIGSGSVESNPLNTQALLVQSELIIQEVINNLQLKNREGVLLKPESVAITVETIPKADGLTVSYVSEDSKLAAVIVNQVMRSYIASNILSNRSEAIAAGAFIKKQLPQAKIDLDLAAETLHQFKVQNRIVDLKEEANGTVQTILALDEELNSVRSQVADLSTQEKEVRRQLNLPADKAIDITSLSQIAGVQEVLVELQRVQSQIKTKQTLYTDKNPQLANLKNQEVALESLLQKRVTESLGYQIKIPPNKLQVGEIKQSLVSDFANLRSQRLGLEQKIKSISSLKKSYDQRIYILPSLEKKQGELEQKLLLAQKNYENLWTRFQDIKIVESQTIGNASILQDADVVINPSVMKMKITILIGGGLAGLLIAVAVAFFIDIIDRRVKTAKEAEKLFNYTLLGLIPTFETKSTLDIEDPNLQRFSRRVIANTSPRTVIHEAYQMLQANLKFISLDKKILTIAVTSSLPGEGKSEVAANLAAVMAQAERRVLLVDANMRQPTQHHFWSLINSVGLSNVMVGQDDLERSIQQITPCLSVLTTGVIPPNPLALIDSECMINLINALSTKYDYVIFDTPSLIGTVDAAVLGKMVDGVLVVVRPGMVDSASVAAAKSLLSRSEANILGIVANGVNVKQEPDNYFYYNGSHSVLSAEEVDSTPLP